MKSLLPRAMLTIAFFAAGASANAQTKADTTHLRQSVARLVYIRDNSNNSRRVKDSAQVQIAAESLYFKTHTTTPVPPENAAPVARFTLPAGGCTVNTICTFNGSTSSDDKAVVGYTWDCNVVPQCNSTGATASAVYPHAGETRTVTLTVRDAEGLTSTITRTVSIIGVPLPDSQPPVDTTTPKPPPDSGAIVPPALPRSVPDFQPKPCARSVDVPLGANLQTALNAAVPGDCLELQPGSEYKGNFTLPDHACTGPSQWITLRTKGVVDVPGVRPLPAQAIAERWAKITHAFNQYALTAAHPSKCWQIMHLNVQRDTTGETTTLVYHLFVIGMSASEGNTSLATQPTDFIVRRNWIHGTPNGELVRCVVANGMRIAIVDNWIDDCHASGFDSQAVEGWNGAGPIVIKNNFLAGAGENVMFGGADPADSTLSPADITIVGNHFFKDRAWKGRYSIKNGFELKNARRVLVDGNVFDPCSWVASQVGMCVVVKSSTGGSATILNQGTNDLTFTNNRANEANRGFNLQGRDCSYMPCSTLFVNRVLVRNNLFTNIGTANGVVGNDGWLLPTSDAPLNVTMRNNTFVGNTPNRGLTMYLSGYPGTWNRFALYDNIFAGQGYYAFGADCPQATHEAALKCMFGTGTYAITGNVFSEVDQEYWAKNPANNTYVVNIADLGIQPDYTVPKYPGKGADIALVNSKTAGVVQPAGVAARTKPASRKPRATRPSPADSAWCARNACTLTKQ